MVEATFENQLEEMKVLVSWNKEELLELENVFLKVKTFDPKNQDEENFQEIHGYWYKLIAQIPFPMIPITQSIYRARKSGEKPFSEEWQLSYNSRFPYSTGLGRFNTPMAPVFYGCLKTDNSQHFLLAAALESCKQLSDDLNEQNSFELSYGVWEPNEMFCVISLCQDETHLNDNDWLKPCHLKLLNGLRETTTIENCNFVIKVWEFLASISISQSLDWKQYFISTAFFIAIRNYYKSIGQKVYGLIYPSSMTDGKGLNVVLTTESVDSYLRLDRVFLYDFQIDNIAKKCSGRPGSDLVQVKDKTFSFDITTELRNLYRQAILYSSKLNQHSDKEQSK